MDDNQDIEFNHLEGAINDEIYDQPTGQPEIAEPDTSEIIAPLLQMGFGVLAPNWQVSEPEIEQLSIAYGGLIDKYFPSGVGQYSVEISAVMITAAVVLPRMKTPRKEPELTEQPRPEQGEGELNAAA